MEENQTPDEQEIAVYDFDPQAATRENISAVYNAWSLLESLDENGPYILGNKLQGPLNKAKKQTLEILFANIDYLHRDELPELYDENGNLKPTKRGA